jgi:hypothetical protein
MTDLSTRLSNLAIFTGVVADATRRFQAGELDADGFIAVLERQGFTRAAAIAEARSLGGDSP